jgi:hypothetical protein
MERWTNRWRDEQTDSQQQSLSPPLTEPFYFLKTKLKVFLKFSKIVSYKYFSFLG